MLGIVAGSSFEPSSLEPEEARSVDTPFGAPSDQFTIGRLGGLDVALLRRHGRTAIPPHRINHRANVNAFVHLGVATIVGVNSVGSLRLDMPPGCVLIPDDYISLWHSITFHDDEAVHITPGLDDDLRQRLVRAAEAARVSVVGHGVYIQTVGPRLETRAEVRLLKNFGDVVGMTMAHEATLSREAGIKYASICSVDNYAHGLTDAPPSQEEIVQRARHNSAQVERILAHLMEDMA
jgi:5'-methylthioadenosine phosphorylase